MKTLTRTVVALSLAFASSWVLAQSFKVKLTGDQESPPVKTTAGGEGTVAVAPDKTLTVEFKTTGLNATAAHIHEGEAGKNGPVAIPLVKGGADTWSVAPGTKLTDAQMESLKAGKLYVNVHTAANPGGEIRAQIKQ